jgi:hypothetical protein
VPEGILVTKKWKANEKVGNEEGCWAIKSVRSFLHHSRSIFQESGNIGHRLTLIISVYGCTMKLINAEPKNKEFKTFWTFVSEYESRSHPVPIRIASPRYIAIRTPYANGSRYDF